MRSAAGRVRRGTARPGGYPRRACVHELFEAQAARHAGRDRCRLRRRGADLSRAERAGESARASPAKRGVGAGRARGLCVERDSRSGRRPCWPCSRRAAPMSRSIRRIRADGLRYMLADSAPALVLTQPRCERCSTRTSPDDPHRLGRARGRTNLRAIRLERDLSPRTWPTSFTPRARRAAKRRRHRHRNVVNFDLGGGDVQSRRLARSSFRLAELRSCRFECFLPLWPATRCASCATR